MMNHTNAITVSDGAAKRIQDFLHKRGGGIGVKLGIKHSGCSGLSYQLEFVDQAQPSYHQFEDKGVVIFVENQHLIYLAGVELDFAQDGANEGFSFKNPNSRGGCGCGKSFAV